jgi:tetratricopeptide (TPR) repeat protein
MRILRFVVIIAGIVAALGALVLVLLASNPERRVARLLDEAQIHKRTGKLELATKCLEDAIALTPTNPGLKAKLGRNWRARGELAKAKPLFLEAIAGNPDDVEARFDLFEVELELGELGPAQEQLAILDEKSRVLASESARDRVHAARASLLFRRGDRLGAAKELDETIGPNPARDAPLRLTLAQLLAESGDVVRAEKLARDVWSVRRPKDLKPASTDEERLAEEARFAPEECALGAAFVLGQRLIIRHASDDAVKVVSEAWAREPSSVDLALVLAEAEVSRRGFDAALEIAKKLDSKNEPSAAALVRGRIAIARGDRDVARAEFRDAVRWAPGAPVPAIAAGEIELLVGEKDEAATFALSIDPKKLSLDNRVARARILEASGRRDEARKDVDAVLESAPGHQGALDLLVRLELLSGRVDELMGRIDGLEKRTPGNGFLSRARGLVALWRHEPGEAARIERDALRSANGADATSAELLTAALILDGGVGSAVRELQRVASESKDEGIRERTRLEAASLYLTLGRADLALPVLEQGLAEQPRSRQLRLTQARALIKLGRHADSVRILGPLLDGRGDPGALVLAADAALRAKDPNEAIAFARRALDDPTAGAEALAVLALAARAAGDRSTARDAFVRLRTLRPSAPLGYAGALADLREAPGSVAQVLRAAVAHSDADGFGADLAIALDLAARSDEALDAARAAVSKRPSDPTAANVLACVLARRGDAVAADRALADAGVLVPLRTAFKELTVEDVVSIEALIAFRRHGLDAEAAEEARKLAANRPKNLVVALYAARALAAAGDSDEGDRLLAAAINETPSFAPGWIELGNLRRIRVGIEGGLAVFDEGLLAIRDDPTLELARGMTLSEMGRPADAESAYRAVLRVDPKSSVARNNLAWILLEKGTSEGVDAGAGKKRALDEGIAFARSTVADNPDSPLPLDTLARLELARGDAKSALEHERQAIARAPENATIHLGLALALDSLGEVKGAAHEYEIALLLSATFDGRQKAEARLAEIRGSTRSGS